LKLVDTSVVVAAFASWHEFHPQALAVLRAEPGLPAQSALETYSVLTRLPPPHRASPGVVQEFLTVNFKRPYLSLTSDGFAALIGELADNGIVGGAAYDALIGAVARDAGATLVTCDQRARLTYERIGVSVEYLTQVL
jgi:predicted nucleic acid-binding protein